MHGHLLSAFAPLARARSTVDLGHACALHGAHSGARRQPRRVSGRQRHGVAPGCAPGLATAWLPRHLAGRPLGERETGATRLRVRLPSRAAVCMLAGGGGAPDWRYALLTHTAICALHMTECSLGRALESARPRREPRLCCGCAAVPLAVGFSAPQHALLAASLADSSSEFVSLVAL